MLCPQAFNIQVSGVVAKKEKEKQEEKEAPFLIACLLATPTVPSLGFFQDRLPFGPPRDTQNKVATLAQSKERKGSHFAA